MVKKVTNWHTPIQVSVKKICKEVKNKQAEQKIAINSQRISNSCLIDRNYLKNAMGLITHQAIDFVLQELNAAKKW